jgi:hypothetical protein
MTIAGRMIALGIPVIPLGNRSKNPNGALAPHGWKNLTLDPAVVARWHAANPAGNCGSVATDDGVCIVDFDNQEFVQEFLDATGLTELPRTFTVQTMRGYHLYHKPTDFSRAAPNVALRGGELKLRGFYAVSPGSSHPDGGSYEILHDVPIIPIPDCAVDFFKQRQMKRPKGLITRSGSPAQLQEGIRYLEKFARAHHVEFYSDFRPFEDDGSQLRFVPCPNIAHHTSGFTESEAAVFVMIDGSLGFCCQHAHCADWGWQEFKQHHSPKEAALAAIQFELAAMFPPTQDACDKPKYFSFPQAALYGYLGDLARSLGVPLGFALLALLTVFSARSIPLTDDRLNLYCILVGPPECGKSEALKRALRALGCLPSRPPPRAMLGSTTRSW